jgi:hypothetical protein
VAGDAALAEFRQALTGPAALKYLADAGGRLLVNLPVGVGKTEWMKETIAYALASETHDLVIVLVPRWDVLNELLRRLPPDPKPYILRPRPRQRCGDLDAEWVRYEQNRCGYLGRATLCGSCPRRGGCPWPGQYGGKRLNGENLILATQQHLSLDPRFVARITGKTGAQNPLVLIDESNLLVRPADRVLAAADLGRFVTAQEDAHVEGRSAATWLDLSRLLVSASTDDLRQSQWRFPPVVAGWAVDVQRAGRERFGETFRFPAFDLRSFAVSDIASRERLPNGDIHFATLPGLGRQFIVYSGSMAQELARYRIDPNFNKPRLVSPFACYRFEHPGTMWFNINTMDGAAKYFTGNAERLLTFFAGLIARNVVAGKRTLLVSRKCFVGLCQRRLKKLLADTPGGPVQIISKNWDRHGLLDPRVIPLISYGMVGLNQFEHVEAAYCLNSYFVAAEAVAQVVHDIEATPERYPVTIQRVGNPPRRAARVEIPDGHLTAMPRVAEEAHVELEANVVVQAVGRVRPFTSPREVITMSVGPLPGVKYTREFCRLAEAREFFGVPTAAEQSRSERAETIRQLKRLKYSNSQIAVATRVSKSTVKNVLREGVQ